VFAVSLQTEARHLLSKKIVPTSTFLDIMPRVPSAAAQKSLESLILVGRQTLAAQVERHLPTTIFSI
jgi:hypothetical protein